VEESYHKFEKEFQDQIDILEPQSDDQLDEIFREYKSQALKLFKKIAVGDDMQGKFVEDLKKKIKKKYDMLKADNTRNVEHSWQAFLSNLYTSIE
jgi:hypothetical protein